MRTLLTIVSLLLAVTTVNAVPAKPVKKKIMTADGATVEVTLRGDEHFSYYTDEGGHYYVVGTDGVAKPMTNEKISELWTARKNAHLEAMGGSHRAARRAVGKPTVTTGKHRGLVILVQFSDVSFTTQNANSFFQDFFNKENYTDNGMTGSVRDYFLAQSYGQLEIDFDVVGPYTTLYKMAYYGAPSASGDNDSRPEEMVAEAVTAASKDVDFSNYDWDGDGEVDQVFVVYAGYAQAQGGSEDTIWPHEYSLAAAGIEKVYNGVRISTYGCSSELRYGSGEDVDGIGSACHEFSHCLGLPDMYDTVGNGYGMASWDVMCSGNYNNDSCTPAGYTAYERWFAGWMKPTEINSMTRINGMKPLATDKEAYVLYNEANRNEYYLLENRQPVGFDAGLPYHGLLIVHVDYNETAWQGNKVNAIGSRQRMTVIAADNDYTPYYTSRMAGDPWPGTSGNTMLNNYTTPAAILYNANKDGTLFMNKQIDNITEDEEAMTVSFVACRPELGVPANIEATEIATGNSFKLAWPAVTGAVGYEIELTAIDKAASTPSEALLEEYDFSQCYSKTVGFTDISSKLVNYGLSAWHGSKLFTTPYKLRIGTSTTNGYIQTPSWRAAPESLLITFVMGADVVTSGTSVKGTMKFETAIKGGSTADIVAENVEFEVKGNGKQVFNFAIPNQNNLYRLTISPQSQMYLNYLAIYDGTWTAEQLGINNAPALAPRRAAVTTTYNSNTNSYTFTNMDTNKRYVCRVRTLGEENTYSQWSAEQSFEFSTSSIMFVESDANAPARYFDLSGREVDASARGVIIIKQGNTTRKVVR